MTAEDHLTFEDSLQHERHKAKQTNCGVASLQKDLQSPPPF